LPISTRGVSWSDLPLAIDDIERIEVIRGPNAASYGANAFLAIINITTRHAGADPGAFVRASAGSNDIRDGVLRAAGGNDAVSYRLTTAYQQDSGYGLRNDDRQITLFNGRIDGRASRKDEIEYQFGYNQGPRGRGYADRPSDPERDQEITSRFQQLRWRHRFDSGDEIAVQLYYNHHESDEPSYTLTVPSVFVDYSIMSERYDAEFQHTVGLGEDWRLVWGVGARRDSVEWPGFLGTPDAIDHRHFRLFGNLEWRATDQLLFNLGAMYERSSITGADVSPRLAVNYHLTPGHTLRASISSATRQPVLLEEESFARFCINPTCAIFTQTFASSGNLDPEKIISGELGYLGRLTPSVTLDLRVFNDQITKLIGVFDTPYPETYGSGWAMDFRNSGKARILGSEAQLEWRPERGTRVLFGYANVNIESNNADEAWYSRSAPRNSLSLLGLRELGAGWQASGAIYFQDEMVFLDGHDVIDTVWRVDLRLARRFQLPGASAEAALVLQNLIDPQPDYYPESVPHRIGYFTFSLQTR
jgi:iron complex outermembrane recepter protein